MKSGDALITTEDLSVNKPNNCLQHCFAKVFICKAKNSRNENSIGTQNNSFKGVYSTQRNS